jgi:hypothetical protein
MDYRNVKFDAVITCRTIPQVEQAIQKEARSYWPHSLAACSPACRCWSQAARN